MDQAVETGREFDERAEIGQAGYFTLHALANLEILAGESPWIRRELFHAERNAASFRADLEDLDFHRVPRIHEVGRFRDTVPGHVGDMQQTVQAAQIDEGAEIGDAANGAAYYRAFASSASRF